MSITTPSPIAPGPTIPGPARHRPARTAAVVAGAAALITAGGFGAVAILGANTEAPRPVLAQRSTPPIVPSEEALRENRDTIATLYAPQASTGIAATTTPTARARAIEDNRRTVAKLYAPQASTGIAATSTPTARARAIEANRETIDTLYGNGG